jgi:hypothetical protein
VSERRAILEKDDARADPLTHAGKAGTAGEESEERTQSSCRGSGDGMYTRGERAQHGKPDSVVGRDDQPGTGDGWTGRYGVAERPVLLRRPGNAGGGKGPWFKAGAGSGKAREIGATLLNSVDV